MIDETLEESAALYALDLLEGEELRAFESKVASDPALQAKVREFQESVASVAYGAPNRALSPELRARILAQPPARPASHGTSSSFSTFIPWALAACLAIACALLASERGHLQKRIASLQHRNELSQAQITTLTSKLASAPNAEAVVIWDPESKQGVLKVLQAPPSGDDHSYQLWVVDPAKKTPVSAAIFRVGSTGTTKISFKPDEPVSSAKAFAISLERKGGVTGQAKGPIVLITPQ